MAGSNSNLNKHQNPVSCKTAAAPAFYSDAGLLRHETEHHGKRRDHALPFGHETGTKAGYRFKETSTNTKI